MARPCSKIKKKTTKEGVEVTLEGNTITKKYSCTSFVFMTFKTNAEAKREFSNYRQGRNIL